MIRRTDTSAESLAALAEILARGGIVLLPTDTIYGLHGRADDASVSARIAAMKGRDASKAFVVIAADVAQLESLGAAVPEVVKEIWPAPLTAVVRLASQQQTLAVRIPAVDWLRDLLTRTGPLISTSANRAGEPPISSPDLLARDLLSALDGLLDLGPRSGEPSTIVDFTGDEPRFIREGDPAFTQNLRKTLRISL